MQIKSFKEHNISESSETFDLTGFTTILRKSSSIKIEELTPVQPAIIEKTVVIGKDGRDGKAGVKGDTGEAGKDGKDGIDGKDGAAGKNGSQGIQGISGERGLQGLTGERGEKGDTGEKGEVGERGEKGDTGEKGEVGIAGKDGIDAKGIKGDKGDQGNQGNQGSTGEKGDKGDQGDTGDKGDKGDTGERGEKGDQGISGKDGQAGVDGKDGQDGKFVKGEKGDKGDKGDRGKDGDRGRDGKDGVDGKDGDKGDQGIQGDKGDQGIQGDQGDMPNHEYAAGQLRFEISNGNWGEWINLKRMIDRVSRPTEGGGGSNLDFFYGDDFHRDIKFINFDTKTINLERSGDTINISVNTDYPTSKIDVFTSLSDVDTYALSFIPDAETEMVTMGGLVMSPVYDYIINSNNITFVTTGMKNDKMDADNIISVRYKYRPELN